MKNFLKFFFFLFIFPTIVCAAGGDEKGNGGNLVICRDPLGKIARVELLDYYEAKVMRGMKLLSSEANFNEILSQILENLGKINPGQAKKYQEKASTFFENAKFYSGVQFVNIDDSLHIFLPKGCAVEQVAVQKKPQFPEDRLFNINKDLWDLMSEMDRAGLILHEIIYSELLTLGQKESTRTRYFNASMARGDFSNISPKAYHELAKLVGLDGYMNYNGMLINIHSAKFDSENNLTKAYLKHDTVYENKGFKACIKYGDVEFTDGYPTKLKLCNLPEQEVFLSKGNFNYKIKFTKTLDSSLEYTYSNDSYFFTSTASYKRDSKPELLHADVLIESLDGQSHMDVRAERMHFPVNKENLSKLSAAADRSKGLLSLSDERCGILINPKYNEKNELISLDKCETGALRKTISLFNFHIDTNVYQFSEVIDDDLFLKDFPREYTNDYLRFYAYHAKKTFPVRSVFSFTPVSVFSTTINEQSISFKSGEQFTVAQTEDQNKQQTIFASGIPSIDIEANVSFGAKKILLAKEHKVQWVNGRAVSGTLAENISALTVDDQLILLQAGDEVTIGSKGKIIYAKKRSGSVALNTLAGELSAYAFSYENDKIRFVVLAEDATLAYKTKDETCFLFKIALCTGLREVEKSQVYPKGAEVFFDMDGYVGSWQR